MSEYEVRELHKWHHPLRWAVHKGFKLVATFKTDAEAYKFMNERIQRPVSRVDRNEVYLVGVEW